MQGMDKIAWMRSQAVYFGGRYHWCMLWGALLWLGRRQALLNNQRFGIPRSCDTAVSP
jgi:hypothetical protein